jgi:hypothetical protein
LGCAVSRALPAVARRRKKVAVVHVINCMFGRVRGVVMACGPMRAIQPWKPIKKWRIKFFLTSIFSISELAYDVGLVDEEEYNNLLWDLSGTIHL